VPSLDVKTATPVGKTSPTSTHSSAAKGDVKRNSAGKRGETMDQSSLLLAPPTHTSHSTDSTLAVIVHVIYRI
jgi:hypothetical protein